MTPTQVLTLGMLAVAWLAIAFPLAMRQRSESLSGSITGFTQAMSVLDPEPKASTVSAATTTTSHRQSTPHVLLLRRVLVAAVLSSVVLAAAAVAWGAVFVPLFGVAALGTVGYVATLRRRKVEQDRARAVITSIRDNAVLRDGRGRHTDDRPQAMPRAVGDGHDWTQPTGFASDVRVVSRGQRIEAHAGFDVLD